MTRALKTLLAAAVLSLGVAPTSASAAVYVCKDGQCVHLRGRLPTLEQCNRWAAGTSTVCFMSGMATSPDSSTVVLGGSRQSVLSVNAEEERRLTAIVQGDRGAAGVNRFQAMVAAIAAKPPPRSHTGPPRA